MESQKKIPWYVAGLHFECAGCGGCCSGPGEGYIWVVRAEIELMAKHLGMSSADFRREYLKRVGFRTSIIEHVATRDCIFLTHEGGRRICRIYSVRPSQCRSWPFWPENLKSQSAWNRAAQKCSGINRGRLYSYDEIETMKKARKWWQDNRSTGDCSDE